MTKDNDILGTLGKDSFRVPDRYFDDLKCRLDRIPSGNRNASDPGLWRKFSPYLALAACFAVAVTVGNVLLKNTSGVPSDEQGFGEFLYSEMILSSSPYPVYILSETEEEQLSDEDIISYLLESNVTEDQLACIGLFE